MIQFVTVANDAGNGRAPPSSSPTRSSLNDTTFIDNDLYG